MDPTSEHRPARFEHKCVGAHVKFCAQAAFQTVRQSMRGEISDMNNLEIIGSGRHRDFFHHDQTTRRRSVHVSEQPRSRHIRPPYLK